MGAQAGKDLLIKLDMDGGGSFSTIAGLRATRVTFNAETVDVTTLESTGGWRELLGGAGVRSASLSGSGIFKDATTDERARQVFFDGLTPGFQVIVPDFGGFKPMMLLKVVVLPAPLRPSRQTTCPFLTFRDTSKRM